MPVRVTGRVLQAPKNRGYSSEDASALSEGRMRFAVADGASEGVDVTRWARSLVSRYLADPPAPNASPADVYAWFRAAIHAWDLDRPTTDPDDWRFSGVGAVDTAFATFLGVQFVALPGDRLAWAAIAVGDSCLIHLPSARAREGGARTTLFPYTASTAFTATPHLVPSDLDKARRLAPTATGPAIHMRGGIATAGDVFLLGSDAVSKWLYTLRETHQQLWTAIPTLSTRDLDQVVRASARTGAIDRDDITLAVLRVRDAVPTGSGH